MAKVSNKRQAIYGPQQDMGAAYQQAMQAAMEAQQSSIGNYFFGPSREQRLQRQQTQRALDYEQDQALMQGTRDRQAMAGKQPVALGMNTALTDAGVDNPYVRAGLHMGMQEAGTEQEIANAQARAQIAMTSPQYSQQAAQRAELNRMTQQQQFQQAQVNLEKSRYELDMLRNGVLPPAERLKTEESMRDNFRADWNTYEEVLTGYQVLDNALTEAQSNPAATFAAVVKFAKILDPGSVVRTEEGRAVSDSADGRVQTLLNQFNVAKGGGWDPGTVAKMRSAAEQITSPYVDQALSIVDQYSTTAREYNINPNNLFMGKAAGLDVVRQMLGDLVVVPE